MESHKELQRLLNVPAHIRARAEELGPQIGIAPSKLIQRWLKHGLEAHEQALDLVQPKQR